MDIDAARLWLTILADNLLDNSYAVCIDDETHFKISAIQTILARHEKLEAGLAKLDNLRDQLGNVIAPLL